MKFLCALIAFAAFANADLVKNKNAPITTKDIDKLLNDINKYEECKTFHINEIPRTDFRSGKVKGYFVLHDVSLWSGNSRGFAESTSLGEKDLSIGIGPLRSGMHSEGRIQFIGSASGKDFDETGTFRFVLDDKSIQLDTFTIAEFVFDQAYVSIQGVHIDEMTQDDQEAAVLEQLKEMRQVLQNATIPEELIQSLNAEYLQNISPRELYDQLRRAIPEY